MNKIGKEERELLIKIWIPRIDRIVERRAFVRRAMVFFMCAPFVVFLLLLACLLVIGDTGFLLKSSALLSIFLGLAAVGFVYLGKMQACDDILESVTAVVILGDRTLIMASMDRLSCLGRMDNLLRDLKPFLHPGPGIDEHRNNDDNS